MIDFSKLREITPEERQLNEKRRKEREITEDPEKRHQHCKHRINITISEEPESRFNNSGTPILHLRGLDDQGRPVRVDWFAPDHVSRDDLDRYFERFLPETPLSLQGYWKPFKSSTGRTSFTFIAQFIELR